MRKLMISLAAAGTVLAFATPAAAQYYPQQSYGYGQQYGGYGQQYSGYGNNGWGQMRALQARIDAVEHQIRRLDRRDVIPDYRADRLRNEAQNVERQLHFAARNGLNPYEANAINGRIAWLERQVQYSLANRYGGYGNSGYHDRDRDGRDDRYENDHGWDHDD
jgi:hypothetical protein